MDPYKILDLPKNFTLEQLKANYKRVALKTHPDKSGCSDYLFKLVTQSYKALLKELERRESDKPFQQMKHNSRTTLEKQGMERGSAGGSSFNINKFNQVFDQYKVEDAVDKGYGNWMSKSRPDREDINIDNKIGKVSADKFNTIFEKNVTGTGRNLVVYKEPEAMMSTKRMGYAELGVSRIGDFSGDNLTNKTLNYMDYRKAHTTTHLVDRSGFGARQEYNSIDDLQADRSSMRTTMTAKEQRLYVQKQMAEAALEKQRQENIAKQDQILFKQYEKISRLLLGR